MGLPGEIESGQVGRMPATGKTCKPVLPVSWGALAEMPKKLLRAQSCELGVEIVKNLDGVTAKYTYGSEAP